LIESCGDLRSSEPPSFGGLFLWERERGKEDKSLRREKAKRFVSRAVAEVFLRYLPFSHQE